MEFDYSERTNELAARLTAFMDEHVIPDEVHRNQIGKLELSKYKARPGAASGVQTAAG